MKRQQGKPARGEEMDKLYRELAVTADIALLIKPVAYAIPNFCERLQGNYISSLESLSEVISERILDSLEKLETLTK